MEGARSVSEAQVLNSETTNKLMAAVSEEKSYQNVQPNTDFINNGEKVRDSNVPDGPLATLLKTSLEKTIEKYLHSLRFSLFSKHYLPIYKHHPNELKDIHQQLLSQLEGNIKQEMGLMYEEENIVPLLNNLDEMKAKSDKKQKGWRPSGSPHVDLQDHLYPVKMEHKKALEQMLVEEATENENLKQQISKNRKELQEMTKQMDNKVKEFNEVVTLISCLPTQKLEETLHSCLETMNCSP